MYEVWAEIEDCSGGVIYAGERDECVAMALSLNNLGPDTFVGGPSGELVWDNE